MIVKQAHPAAAAQIFMHRKPHIEPECERIGQNRNQIRVASRDRELAAGDPEPGAGGKGGSPLQRICQPPPNAR